MERSPIFLISVSFSFWHLNLAPWPFRESPEVYGSPSSLASSTAILTISMQHSTQWHNGTQFNRRYVENIWKLVHLSIAGDIPIIPPRSTHIGNMPTISNHDATIQNNAGNRRNSHPTRKLAPATHIWGLVCHFRSLCLLSQSHTSHGFFFAPILWSKIWQKPRIEWYYPWLDTKGNKVLAGQQDKKYPPHLWIKITVNHPAFKPMFSRMLFPPCAPCHYINRMFFIVKSQHIPTFSRTQWTF